MAESRQARAIPMQNILLQTTIEGDSDDWHIGRFHLLKAFLEGIRDEHGEPAFRVTARNQIGRAHV